MAELAATARVSDLACGAAQAAVPSGAAGVLKAELFAHGLEEGSIPGLSWPYANGAIELFGTAETEDFCCVNCSC